MLGSLHIHKLDVKVSKIIKARIYCEKCHKRRPLDPAHIFGRRYINTRWDIELNVLGLCRECHDWAHANPNDFENWIIKKTGQSAYDKLRAKAYAVFDHFYETEDEKIDQQVKLLTENGDL